MNSNGSGVIGEGVLKPHLRLEALLTDVGFTFKREVVLADELHASKAVYSYILEHPTRWFGMIKEIRPTKDDETFILTLTTPENVYEHEDTFEYWSDNFIEGGYIHFTLQEKDND